VLRSFLEESRNDNEVNSGKPLWGNPEPSPERNQRKGVETIPQGSTEFNEFGIPIPMGNRTTGSNSEGDSSNESKSGK
jgi:hypothetical protein